MAFLVTHQFISVAPDDADTSLVRPTDWNASHAITMATSRLLGRATAGAGTPEEITLGSNLSFTGTTLNAGGIGSISAASKLLGRGSAAGGGVTEEITLGAGLAMSGTTLAATAAAFTGSLTAPATPNAGDFWYDLSTGVLSIYINDGNSSQWVMVSPGGGGQGGGGGHTTGDVKLTFKVSADAGWILCNDGSIGDATSGATTRGHADTSNLFTLFYTNMTALVVQDSAGATVARGANAAADFAAHRRLVIPTMLGRSLAVAGAGAGLTARTLGSTAGAETETPTIAKTAAHSHTTTAFDNAANESIQLGSFFSLRTIPSSTVGTGAALNIVDPSSYLNVMVKL